MSTPDITPAETMLIDYTALKKMFAEAKADDFTRGQFEVEKTKRLQALSTAFAAAVTVPDVSGYGQTPRQQILDELLSASKSVYDSAPQFYR